MDEVRKGARIVCAPENPLPEAIELIEGLGLPAGLLPLEDVVEAGHVEKTGFVWLTQRKPVSHYFKKAGRMVSYGENITCTIEKNSLKNLTGVKAKILVLWLGISEITMDEPPSSKVRFKCSLGLTKTFPAEAFARGE